MWYLDLFNFIWLENDNGGGVLMLLLVFILVLVVVFIVLVGMVVFLIVVLYVCWKRGIRWVFFYGKVFKWKLMVVRLLEDGGLLDLLKGDGVVGEGGVEGVEFRWLEMVDLEVWEVYNCVKGKLIVLIFELKID